MMNDKYISLEDNQLKLIRCERELRILEDPSYMVMAISSNMNRARRNHRYLLRHIKRNIKRLIIVIAKQSMQRSEDLSSVLKHSKIVRYYDGYIIMAQSEDDYKSKLDKIKRFDTRGFYTIKRGVTISKNKDGNS